MSSSNSHFSQAIYCEDASASVDCVRLLDSSSPYAANTPAEESLVFLATKTLATSRDDLCEKYGLGILSRANPRVQSYSRTIT